LAWYQSPNSLGLGDFFIFIFFRWCLIGRFWVGVWSTIFGDSLGFSTDLLVFLGGSGYSLMVRWFGILDHFWFGCCRRLVIWLLARSMHRNSLVRCGLHEFGRGVF
jgi:hypothetical protein